MISFLRVLIPYFTIVLGIVFYIFSFNSGIPIPQETHWFASLVNSNYPDKEIGFIYKFLRVPVYDLLFQFIFPNIKYYIIFTYVFKTFTVLAFFYILKQVTKNTFLSLIFTLFFGLLFFNNIITRFDYQFLKYPGGWGDVSLSGRILVNFLYLFIVYFLIRKKESYALFLLLLSFWCHPSNAVSIFVIVFCLFIVLFYIKQIKLKHILLLILVLILGSFPKLTNIFEINEYLKVSITGIDWYQNMIRNEPDDFSALFAVYKEWRYYFIYLVVILLSVVLYIKKYQNYSISLILFSILPIVLLFFVALVEYLNQYFQIDFLNIFIITPGFGLKLIGYSFFPLVIIWALLVNNTFKLYDRSKFVILVCFIFIGLMVVTALKYKTEKSKANLSKYIKIFTNEKTYYEYSELLKLARHPIIKTYTYSSYIQPIYINDDINITQYKLLKDIISIIELDEITKKSNIPNVLYNNIYAKNGSIDGVIKFIKSNIEYGKGIIIPPYYGNMRDVLFNWPIFFQEHHDGNLMIGGKKITSIFNNRMELLLGFNSMGLPGLESNLQATIMREAYLKVDEIKLNRICKKYPSYKYILTEYMHTLKEQLVYKDELFNIYKFSCDD